MQLAVYKTLWDWLGDWRGQLGRIQEAGYCGVEYTAPADPANDPVLRAELDALKLGFIAQVVTRGPDHTASFRAQCLRAAEFNPVLINAHSAADCMPFDDQLRFFEAALRVEEEIGIRIAHETHRGRAFFTPWTTAAVLRELPNLKVGADLSHWCVACERMPRLDDADVQLTLARAIHIHGRVGHQEGPQVSDPRAPEFAEHLELFLQMWVDICKARQQAGYTTMTFTPEFGPAPYMPEMPFTRAPLVDLWEVNLWMFDVFKRRFNATFP